MTYLFFFFFKQKTAYEMRISDWSSDVCSSDLLKPGSATKPFVGVALEIVDAEGKVLEGATEGNLVVTRSWPGQMRTVWGDHARFFQTYFSTYKGKYFTGDGCRRDADGYYWITGRVDDVINVRSKERGVGKGCVRQGRYRWSAYN